ncbi:MAG: SPFH domain-containing protein, partial [bacterium]
VRAVELKQIDLPQEMQRMMAKQAEAEREKRAKVTLAEGEYQAAQRIADAAETLSTQPSGLQLRYLQTLAEIAGSGKNSTTIFPVPIDMVRPFYDQLIEGRDAMRAAADEIQGAAEGSGDAEEGSS